MQGLDGLETSRRMKRGSNLRNMPGIRPRRGGYPVYRDLP
jgi:hypothetical protein